jgi:DNA (cytosine-5)-methyltransferase 1
VGAGSETIISHAVAAHAAKGGDPTTDNYVVTHSLTGVEPDVVGALPTGHTPNGHGMAGVNSQAAASGHIDGGYSPNLLPSPMGVRRLTPTECERLMSWEDGWTAFGASGKEMSDSTRYRMAGNGVVSNVAEWIARRIREVSA